MEPRITINLAADGLYEIWMNEKGRDLLVRKLQELSEKRDHLHLGPKEIGSEVEVSSRPYRSDDKILEYGKIYFRPDEWDKKHYPHVLDSRG